jgi:hypothetical protein
MTESAAALQGLSCSHSGACMMFSLGRAKHKFRSLKAQHSTDEQIIRFLFRPEALSIQMANSHILKTIDAHFRLRQTLATLRAAQLGLT